MNSTSGVIEIACSGALTPSVGVFVRTGAGSGGASAGLSPRFMQGSGGAVAFELRPAGNGPAFSTWTEVFVTVPTPTGSGLLSVSIYADITTVGVRSATGL